VVIFIYIGATLFKQNTAITAKSIHVKYRINSKGVQIEHNKIIDKFNESIEIEYKYIIYIQHICNIFNSEHIILNFITYNVQMLQL
jgi:hypothetical protein